MAAAIHAHTLDTSYADQKYANIIAAVPFVGKRYKLPGGAFQIHAVAHNSSNIKFIHRAMQPVRAKQKNIFREYLMFLGIHIDKETAP